MARLLTMFYLCSAALLPSGALGAPVQDMPGIFVKWSAYLFLLFIVVVAGLVYFLRFREDRQAAPLSKLSTGRGSVHCVGPDEPVLACVRKMTAERIGAVVVTDRDQVVGIFTERDALNKVLAAGRDPRQTTVSEVMTRDPLCVPPSTSVAAAMELVTKRRFRHLPIVEDGKVLAMVSSGDLTSWLVNDESANREYVPLAARSP